MRTQFGILSFWFPNHSRKVGDKTVKSQYIDWDNQYLPFPTINNIAKHA